MATAKFKSNHSDLLERALSWAQQYEQICLYHSNSFKDDYSAFDALLCVGVQDEFTGNGQATFERLAAFKNKHKKKYISGYLSYDLKNELEDLETAHRDYLKQPESYFFVPQITIKFLSGEVHIDGDDPTSIFNEISNYPVPNILASVAGSFRPRMSKEKYSRSFENLSKNIQIGNIYEVNLCQEFYIDSVDFEPLPLYLKLINEAPSPFSVYFKNSDFYILSASPERFLAKRGLKIISQPIKGTAGRGQDREEDERLKKQLFNSPKELSENVMIVDLVRNDLTRNAKEGTVSKQQNLSIQTFSHVHQLVSTITCEVRDETEDLHVLKDAFPPGSMTGAPKYKAMQLADANECSKRGIYAGSIGYFAPDGDFDFNVVIRSLQYNRQNNYLSFHTGGAITYSSTAHDEYEECLIKASTILESLGSFIEE